MREDLNEVRPVNEKVDRLDANERNDDAADAVDEQVALQDFGRAERAEFHAAQRQRNERDDDERIENDGAQNRSWAIEGS